MTAIVFAGPSIRGLEKPSPGNLIFRPPAKQGDVFRASLGRPRAIGIIDGYFDGVPAVWHKEILWALSQGIRVFGGASMGALRAAELDGFGMTGVGRIYQWYRDGILEDDDEVALIHGPEDSGFLAMSEPMINVRATCEAAVATGILDQSGAKAIIAAAKHQHYRERTWDAVLAAAAANCPAVDKFRSWLAAGRVDQKRLDAAELIKVVAAFIEDGETAPLPDFHFQWTDLWDRVFDQWTVSEPALEDPEGVSQSAVLDELRLDPDRYAVLRLQALQRAVLLREADRRHVSADLSQKRGQLRRLRERLGLMRKSDLDAWVKRNGLEAAELEALMGDEARIGEVSRLPPGTVERHVLAILKLDGAYPAAAQRAEAKRRLLEGSGLLVDGRLAESPSPPMLLGWFFGRKLRRAIPDDLDQFIENIGFTTREAFYRLLAGEQLYSQEKNDGSEFSQLSGGAPES